MQLLVFKRSEPFNYPLSASPVIHIGFGYYFLIGAVKDLLAYSSYLRLGWADQSGW